MFPHTTTAQRDLATFHAKLAAYGETPRFWRINRYEAFYNGQQYEGRPSFWNNDFPLRERAPVVQVGFTRAAVNRLATLVFGDRAFPRLTVEARVLRATLTDAEHTALQALVDDVARALTLSHRMRQVLVEGLKCASACVVTGLVDGVPALEILPSKWCTPTLRRDGSVESLVAQWKCPDGEHADRWRWYRREITATYDRVYASVPFEEGRVPEWATVPYTETPLAFCPVVWVRNLRPATASDTDLDGTALIEGLEDEIEALDLELSQQFRNALYNGEPQMVKIGAQAPAPDGRPADPHAFSWANTALNAVSRAFVSGGAALKKSPVRVWELPQGGDAKLVESSGAGATIIKGAIDELRRVLCDATGVVLVDPHTLGNGDLSARALTLMHAPMLDVADNLRVEYGAVLVAIVNQTLRHLASTAPEGVRLPAYDAARGALMRLWGVAPDGARAWIGATLTLGWGAYFEPSASDKSAAVETAQKANGGRPVLSQRAAVTSIATLFDVADVDAEVEAIDAEETRTRGVVTDALTRLTERDTTPAEDDAPEVTIEPAADPVASAPDGTPVAKAADAALNGAQTKALLDTIAMVARGEVPRDAAQEVIMLAFLVDASRADRLLGSAGRGFTPPTDAPVKTMPPVQGAA